MVKIISFYAPSRNGKSELKYILHIGHSKSKTNMLGSYLECKHKKQRIEVPL